MKKLALMLFLVCTTVLARAQYAQVQLYNHSSYFVEAKLYGNAPAPMPVCTLGPQTDFYPVNTTSYSVFDAGAATYLVPSVPAPYVFNTVLLGLHSGGSKDLSRFSVCSLPASGSFYFPLLGIWLSYTATVSSGVIQIDLY